MSPVSDSISPRLFRHNAIFEFMHHPPPAGNAQLRLKNRPESFRKKNIFPRHSVAKPMHSQRVYMLAPRKATEVINNARVIPCLLSYPDDNTCRNRRNALCIFVAAHTSRSDDGRVFFFLPAPSLRPRKNFAPLTDTETDTDALWAALACLLVVLGAGAKMNGVSPSCGGEGGLGVDCRRKMTPPDTQSSLLVSMAVFTRDCLRRRQKREQSIDCLLQV